MSNMRPNSKSEEKRDPWKFDSESHRPDTRARIAARGTRIMVRGLDFFDGTPILDIKTYCSQHRTDEFTVPEWFRKLAGSTGHV